MQKPHVEIHVVRGYHTIGQGTYQLAGNSPEIRGIMDVVVCNAMNLGCGH